MKPTLRQAGTAAPPALPSWLSLRAPPTPASQCQALLGTQGPPGWGGMQPCGRCRFAWRSSQIGAKAPYLHPVVFNKESK